MVISETIPPPAIKRRRSLFCGLAVAALLGLNACGHGGAYYLDRANTLFAKGDLAEADLNYRKAVQKDPNNGEAFYRAGLCDLKENKPVVALQDLDQAVHLMPDNKDAKRQLANVVLGGFIGDPSRPQALYDRLVRMSNEWLQRDPQSAEGLRIKGYLAMLEKRPEEGVTLFARAQQANPKDERMNMGLMDAYFRAGEPAKAEKVGLDFIASDHTAGDVYDALFRMYVAARRPADAENILIRKTKENPKENAYLLQLAGYYASVGKKPEMEGALRTLVTNPGGDSQVRLKAGDFYAGLGNWPTAIEQYQAGMAANEKDKPVYQFRIARALLMENKRDEATKLLNAAVAEHPDDKDTRTLRAALLLGNSPSGKPGFGVADLKSMVEKNPDDDFLKISYAKALMETGDLNEARTQFRDLIKKNPQFVDGLVSLADIAFKEGDSREAAERAGAALRVSPNNLRARMLRGSALLRLGQFDEASEILTRISREVPQSMDVRLELGYLAMDQKRYADAEDVFKRVQAVNPKEWRAIAGMVDNDLAQHRADKALGMLEDELERSHSAPQVRYMLATTAMRTGKYSLAVEQFQKLADQTPGSIDPLLQLADAFRARGDAGSAIVTLKKAAALYPNDGRPATMLTYLYQAGNQRGQARLEARRAFQLRPDDPAAMNNLAWALADTGGNLVEALKLARQATDKSPNVPYYADTLAYVYLKKDQNDEAMAILDKLVRQYPNNPDFAYHSGMAFYQMGQAARAKSELSRALQLSPSKETTTAINDLMGLIR
jgi:tetratricopeptide (TPR) repeat protein